MRKSPDAPRRLYSRKSAPCVCFAGKLYAPKGGESTMQVESEVLCEASDTARTVTVKQRRPHAKSIVETWHLVTR